MKYEANIKKNQPSCEFLLTVFDYAN